MVTVLVQFKLPNAITRTKAAELFNGTASKYQNVPGLIRKYYLLTQDGSTAGGVYLWKTREEAEKLYSAEWANFVKDRYGAEPSITYYESPVVVDNLTGQIIRD